MSAGWEASFLAMSAALGESPEDSIAALGGAGTMQVSAIARALQSSRREVRAKAIAQALAEVARDLEATELVWP